MTTHDRPAFVLFSAPIGGIASAGALQSYSNCISRNSTYISKI